MRLDVRLRLERSKGKPPRLVGVLMPYGEQAKDRPELFEAGSAFVAVRGRSACGVSIERCTTNI